MTPLALVSLAVATVCPASGPVPADDPPAGTSVRADTVVVGVVVGVDTATVFSDGPTRLVEVAGGRTLARAGPYEPYRFLVAGGGATAWGPWGELERSAARLRVVPESEEARVFLDGRPYRGQAEVVHRPARGSRSGPSAAGGRLVVASRVEREAYLVSVVSSELGDEVAGAPEAARAQAVAARTYTVAFAGTARRDSLGVDLLADPEADQSYPGLLEEREEAARAVRETRDRILTWDGAPAFTFYHSTCGGRTERPEATWPGESGPDVDLEKLPYLPSVADRPGGGGEDFCAASPHHRWRRAWTGAEVRTLVLPALAEAAEAAGHDVGEPERLEALEVTDRTEHGRVTELTAVVATRSDVAGAGDASGAGGDAGRREAAGEDAPARLDTLRLPASRLPGALPSAGGAPLRSTWFEIVPPEEGEALALEGRGAGHGVGMCQWGALERARQGATWREILAVYYPGTEVRRLER